MKKIGLVLMLMMMCELSFAQTTPEEKIGFEPLEFSSQNFMQYNGFLLNPTFSWQGADKDYISLYHRAENASFDGAPKLYMLNYSTKVGDNKGAALGAFQRSHGIFTTFGGYANFAYAVQLSDKMWLALGANLVYFDSGIKDNFQGGNTDPSLYNMQDQSVISLRPGLNLSVGKFDVGVYAENLVSYSFTNKKMVDAAKRFSGHLMYSTDLSEKTFLKVMARGQKQDSLMAYGGNALFGLHRIGYLQVGYDIFEERSTLSFGLGVNITPNISVNYMMGKTTGEMDLKPTTHQIMFAYNFLGGGVVADRAPENAANEAAQQELDQAQNKLDAMREEMRRNEAERAAMQQRLDSIMQAERNRPKNQVREVEVQAPYKEQAQAAGEAVSQKLMVSAYSTDAFFDAQPGFYIIANVFAKEKNLTRFLGDLRAEGLAPGFFVKRSNRYNYVYIQRYEVLEQAVRGAKNHLNGSYAGDVWILEIK